VGELANPVFYLQAKAKAKAKGTDFLDLERRFQTDDLAHVPRLVMNGIGYASHGGLPSSRGPNKIRQRLVAVLVLGQSRITTEAGASVSFVALPGTHAVGHKLSVTTGSRATASCLPATSLIAHRQAACDSALPWRLLLG
jgi:hypothetical protein